MKDFFRARWKLTIWYTLMLFSVSMLLSSLYYWRSRQIINLQSQRLQQRIEHIIEMDALTMKPMMRAEIFHTERESAKSELWRQIIFINLFILFFGAGASYILAGKTLQPIEQALNSQKRFVSDAAHELKTPLTALRTVIEVSLLDSQLSKKAKNILQENLADVTNLQALTENLLALARTQEGVLLKKSRLLVNTVIDQARKKVMFLAKKKHITIKLNMAKKPIRAMTHERSLLQVLVILLDNAIKYSPPHSQITIELWQHKKQVSIAVKDRGIGIAKRDQAAIFKRFFRVESARTRGSEVGGHGLGLAVAQELISSLGGNICLQSELKKGSTFTICLPKG